MKRAEPVCGGKARFIGLGRTRRAPKYEARAGPNARRTCSHLVQFLRIRGTLWSFAAKKQAMCA